MAEFCGKSATESQSQLGADDAKVWAPGAHFVDNLLRIVEAAAALRLATELGISLVRAGSAAARGLADLILGQSIADAHNHARRDNAIASYSQL